MRSSILEQSPQLVEILFGAYRRRILVLLLLHSDESFYVREIGRITGVPAGSLHRELTMLAEAGLLQRSTVGNQVRYQVDHACPIQEELACIFGSVAQGKERVTSDVDVLVVGSVSFQNIVEALSPAGERLRRAVNPVVMTPAAFVRKQVSRDRFVARLARETKIILLGEAGEFAEPVQDRAA